MPIDKEYQGGSLQLTNTAGAPILSIRFGYEHPAGFAIYYFPKDSNEGELIAEDSNTNNALLPDVFPLKWSAASLVGGHFAIAGNIEYEGEAKSDRFNCVIELVIGGQRVPGTPLEIVKGKFDPADTVASFLKYVSLT